MNAKRNATSAFGKQGALAGTVALASIATLGLAGHITLASEAAGTIQANAPGAEASVREAPTWNAPTSLRSIHDIQGAFAWDQGVNTDNASLSKSLYGASRVLCGAQVDEANAGGLSREVETEGTVDAICQILVNGNVANPGAYDVGQLEDQAPVSITMGCTCAGNPADGLASANAAVEGFELAALVEAAQPTEEANTITLVCSDGYEVAMPLFYVLQHRGIVVTALNGEPAMEAVGCANQLWLGGTSARSFARDIVEILITEQDEPPAPPTIGAEANQPNVGIVAGA